MTWKKQISSPYSKLTPSASFPGYGGGAKRSLSGFVKKGHVPLMVGKEEAEDDHVRFMVPAKLMKHPSMAQLLQESADEFGYEQQGVLRILCDPRDFLEIVSDIRLKKRNSFK